MRSDMIAPYAEGNAKIRITGGPYCGRNHQPEANRTYYSKGAKAKKEKDRSLDRPIRTGACFDRSRDLRLAYTEASRCILYPDRTHFRRYDAGNDAGFRS